MSHLDDLEARAKALREFANETQAVRDRLEGTALLESMQRSYRRRLDTVISDARETAERIDDTIQIEREVSENRQI